MTGRLLIIGMGYTGTRLGNALKRQGWRVAGVRRISAAPDVLAFDDEKGVSAWLAQATHIISSVPPDRDGIDQVLQKYGKALAGAPAQWMAYLSSTGVYGHTGGAWVDESAPVGGGRRSARAEADQAWQHLRADMRIFRLSAIYGPGRGPLERIRNGQAHRIDLPGQIFSRIYVDDILSAIIKSFSGPPAIYNIADDYPCNQNAVIEHGCTLLGYKPPPLLPLDRAGLSPQARAFYTENRRIANGRAKRLLGWRPRYPDFRSGLAACMQALGKEEP